MKISKRIRKKCQVESSEYALMRSKERSDQNGEVFTPTELVLNMLEQLPDDKWEDGKTFLDPTCGNGQFLAAACIIKRELGHSCILATIFGADLMQDNVDDTRHRILSIIGYTENNREVVQKNIVCKDGLQYDYNFR